MSSGFSSSRTTRSGSTSSEYGDYEKARNDSTSTQCSYYSASNLSPTSEYCTLHAASARAQVAKAPPMRPYQAYPKPFGNRENLPFQAQQPLREYPMMTQKNTTFAKEKSKLGAAAEPGALRAIYNNTDRPGFEVGYHNPKLGHNGRNFEIATYRPRVPGSSLVAAALAEQRDREEGWSKVSRR